MPLRQQAQNVACNFGTRRCNYFYFIVVGTDGAASMRFHSVFAFYFSLLAGMHQVDTIKCAGNTGFCASTADTTHASASVQHGAVVREQRISALQQCTSSAFVLSSPAVQG